MARRVNIDVNKILEIAKQRFLEIGIRKTEMKDIAIMMNIGRSSLYRHFPSKEIISFYIGIDIIKDLTSPLFQPEILTGSGFECIEIVMKEFVEKLIINHQEIRFLDEFDELFSGAYPENDASNAFTEFNKRTSDTIQAYLKRGIIDHSIRSDIEPIFTEKLFNNVLFGVAQRVIPRQAHFIIEQGFGNEILRSTLDYLLQGIRAI